MVKVNQCVTGLRPLAGDDDKSVLPKNSTATETESLKKKKFSNSERGWGICRLN